MSFRRHLVTAEPANQNGHRVVQLRIGLKNWFPLEEFLFYFYFFLQFVVACSDFCLKQKEKYTVQGRESTVIHCISW